MSDQEITDVVAWLACSNAPTRPPAQLQPKSSTATANPSSPGGAALSEAPAKGKQSDAPEAKTEVSRRELFAKIGMLLNGLAVAVLATPIIGYLVSPILGADRGQYKRWITLGELDEFPEGQTRLAKFQQSHLRCCGRRDRPNSLLGAPRPGRTVSGIRRQLRAPGMSGALVPAIRFVHVSVSRRRVLPGRLARLRTASARAVRVSLQGGERQAADRSRTTADLVHHRQPAARRGGCQG